MLRPIRNDDGTVYICYASNGIQGSRSDSLKLDLYRKYTVH